METVLAAHVTLLAMKVAVDVDDVVREDLPKPGGDKGRVVSGWTLFRDVRLDESLLSEIGGVDLREETRRELRFREHPEVAAVALERVRRVVCGRGAHSETLYWP